MGLHRLRRSLKTSLLLAVSLLYLSAGACSLPRIIVLNDPLTPEEHINLGLTYEKKGETEQAAEEYKKAAKHLPAAYLYLGNLYYGKSEYAPAEKYYRKSIEKDPGLAAAYNNLAWLLYSCGRNLGEAATLARKATELDPSNETYRDTLARVREKMQQEAEPAGKQ
jgi:tetratricopeptide (TPR) repeat protein